MKPGPRKKPTALRKLEGNPSKRPFNEREPMPMPSMPECPEWLLPDALKEWFRVAPELHRLGLLTGIGRTALAAYCQSYAKWKQAEEFIIKNGLVYPIRNEDGGVKCLQQFPQVGVANQCLRQILAFCARFGLDPSSRATMQLPGERSDDEFETKLRASMKVR